MKIKRFNGVFSRDNLLKKIKMNMKILVHIGLLYFVKKNEIVYFDSFGVEHIPEQIKEFIGNKT